MLQKIPLSKFGKKVRYNNKLLSFLPPDTKKLVENYTGTITNGPKHDKHNVTVVWSHSPDMESWESAQSLCDA